MKLFSLMNEHHDDLGRIIVRCVVSASRTRSHIVSQTLEHGKPLPEAKVS